MRDVNGVAHSLVKFISITRCFEAWLRNSLLVASV